MSNLPPSGEIPRGAIRFNTDSNKPELWDGSQWAEFQLSTPNLGRSVDTQPGARGLFGGGRVPSPGTTSDVIDYINIASTGNAIDFGNLSGARRKPGGLASRTRGVFGGGYTPDLDVIEFVTIASTGDVTDFGNLTVARRAPAGISNATRGIFGGGANNTPSANTSKNEIDYITIASTGNAVDFGDLTVARENAAGGGMNSVRGILAGGYSVPAYNNTIEFITMATLGSAQDFGDFSDGKAVGEGASNKVRAVYAGGYKNPGVSITTIDYVNIMSTGSPMVFGDLSSAAGPFGGVSNCIRGVWAGGYTGGGYTNLLEYIEFSTFGDAADFGDLSVTRAEGGACSNAHGGL